MEKKYYAQSTLYLRLLAGGYLVYTAWDLREAVSVNPLFILAIVAFGVIGALLVGHAGWKLYKGEYEGGPGVAKAEEPAENAEQE